MDELDNNQNPTQKQEKSSGEQELESVAENLERKLSTFLQTHSPSPTGLQDHSRQSPLSRRGEQSEQERTFGDQLDIMSGVSFASDSGHDHAEVASLIAQARDAAHLETAYGTLEEARLRELNSRHEDLKKGIQGLSSVVQPGTSSQNSKATSHKVAGEDEGLGPPPMAVDLDELMSSGLRKSSGNDDNPDDWCCKSHISDHSFTLTNSCEWAIHYEELIVLGVFVL